MVLFDLLSRNGDREYNEDHVGMYQVGDAYCFALADGLGGHGNGELASELAVKAAIESFAAECEEAGGVWDMGSRFRLAQEEIIQRQRQDRRTMGMRTTLTVLEIWEKTAKWGHIGDSRLYTFQNGRVTGRTLDHSVPQMLVNAGELKEKKIRNHPDRNRLLRALGETVEELKFETADTTVICPGQAFLLCSDGFWELIEEKKMEACLRKAESPREWLEQMEKIVLKNGKRRDMDNYSAIGIWIE